MSPELTYAYLAGAIDADGFITISRNQPSASRKDGRKSIYYVAKVGLSEISPIIPDLLHETFGGWRGKHQPSNPQHKEWYIWQVTNAKVEEVLKSLLPYLRLKRTQAELVLQFVEAMKQYRPAVGNALTSEQTALRAVLWEQVTKLNAPRNRRIHFLSPETNE